MTKLCTESLCLVEYSQGDTGQCRLGHLNDTARGAGSQSETYLVEYRVACHRWKSPGNI